MRRVNVIAFCGVLGLVLFAAAASCIAQAPRYKEGDRVEIDVNQAGLDSRFASIEKATVVKVDTQFGRYIFQPDPINGFTPSRVTMPFYKQDTCIRLLQNAQPEPQAQQGAAGVDPARTPVPPVPAANQQGQQTANGKAKYHVGDRVEVETVHAGFSSPLAIVAKGTITAVDEGTFMRYVIQLDPLPGKLPVRHTMPIEDQDTCLRPIGGAAPNIKTEKLIVDGNNTVLADRPLLDCDNLQHGGRNGQPLPVELAKKLIRCIFEKPSRVGQDGATKVDITAFAPGGARKWILYQDQGQGTLDTIVYPIHVTYNMKTYYYGRNVVTTGEEATFTCFADKQNLWQCGFASGPHKDGKKEEILVTK